MQHNTLYATLRFKRRPVSNAIVCFKLRVAYALPVHKYAIDERDISDFATQRNIDDELAALQLHYKCSNIELDAKKDVVARLERNV
jgi:hypothetical protein